MIYMKSIKKHLMEARFEASIASTQKIDNNVDWLAYRYVQIEVKEKTGEVTYQSFYTIRNRYEER